MKIKTTEKVSQYTSGNFLANGKVFDANLDWNFNCDNSPENGFCTLHRKGSSGEFDYIFRVSEIPEMIALLESILDRGRTNQTIAALEAE